MNFVLILEDLVDDGCGDILGIEKLVFIQGDNIDKLEESIREKAILARKSENKLFLMMTSEGELLIEVANFFQMKDGKLEYQPRLITLDDFLKERAITFN